MMLLNKLIRPLRDRLCARETRHFCRDPIYRVPTEIA
jgi:hypothetical protein